MPVDQHDPLFPKKQGFRRPCLRWKEVPMRSKKYRKSGRTPIEKSQSDQYIAFVSLCTTLTSPKGELNGPSSELYLKIIEQHETDLSRQCW